ncbi:MAG: GyrI-like domain-containing protein [Lentisphaerae bacterium]|nr:GyrI-like domain-containing protein [Lentisphaerota bacterium]
MEVTEKLDKKVPDVIIIRIPKFRAVTSELASFDEVFGAFGQWREAHNHLFKSVVFNCSDFLMGKDGLYEWVWGIKDEVMEADTAPYNIIEFEGGLYAVTVSVDGDGESHNKVRAKMDKWLETTNFVEDTSRLKAGHMIYVDDEIKAGLGYNQMNLYLPIKLKI